VQFVNSKGMIDLVGKRVVTLFLIIDSDWIDVTDNSVFDLYFWWCSINFIDWSIDKKGCSMLWVDWWAIVAEAIVT
jgi:hypothetical protein